MFGRGGSRQAPLEVSCRALRSGAPASAGPCHRSESSPHGPSPPGTPQRPRRFGRPVASLRKSRVRLRSANGRPCRPAEDQSRNPARPRQGELGVVPGRVSFQAHPGDRGRFLRVRRAGKRANACGPKSNWRERALRDHTRRPATVLTRYLRYPPRPWKTTVPVAAVPLCRLPDGAIVQSPHSARRG